MPLTAEERAQLEIKLEGHMKPPGSYTFEDTKREGSLMDAAAAFTTAPLQSGLATLQKGGSAGEAIDAAVGQIGLDPETAKKMKDIEIPVDIPVDSNGTTMRPFIPGQAQEMVLGSLTPAPPIGKAGNTVKEVGKTVTKGFAENLVKQARSGALKKLGEGAEALVYDAGDYVVKTAKGLGDKAFKQRVYVDTILSDLGLAPKSYGVHFKAGSSEAPAIIQEKLTTAQEATKKVAEKELVSELKKKFGEKWDELLANIEKAGFSTTDLDNPNNIGFTKEGKMQALDTGFSRPTELRKGKDVAGDIAADIRSLQHNMKETDKALGEALKETGTEANRVVQQLIDDHAAMTKAVQDKMQQLKNIKAQPAEKKPLLFNEKERKAIRDRILSKIGSGSAGNVT